MTIITVKVTECFKSSMSALNLFKLYSLRKKTLIKCKYKIFQDITLKLQLCWEVNMTAAKIACPSGGFREITSHSESNWGNVLHTELCFFPLQLSLANSQRLPSLSAPMPQCRQFPALYTWRVVFVQAEMRNGSISAFTSKLQRRLYA